MSWKTVTTKSIAHGTLWIPLPSPKCSAKLPPLESSDGLFSWTIDLHAEDKEYCEYDLKVFCTASDQNDQLSVRPVSWGGYVKLAPENSRRGDLSLGPRFLKTRYHCGTWRSRTCDHENEMTYFLEAAVTQSVLVPEPEPTPKTLSAFGPACLSKSLGSLLNSGLMSDVKLCTEEQEIAAHRIILAARSEFFKAKFKPEWDGNRVDVDVPLQVLKEMINYIYTGNLGDDVDMIELLIAGDMYLVTDLCNEITERLRQSLVSHNKPAASVCCDLLKKSAIINSSPSLRNIVLRYLKSHREEVLKSEEWAQFQVENRLVAAEAVLDMYNLPD